MAVLNEEDIDAAHFWKALDQLPEDRPARRPVTLQVGLLFQFCRAMVWLARKQKLFSQPPSLLPLAQAVFEDRLKVNELVERLAAVSAAVAGQASMSDPVPIAQLSIKQLEGFQRFFAEYPESKGSSSEVHRFEFGLQMLCAINAQFHFGRAQFLSALAITIRPFAESVVDAGSLTGELLIQRATANGPFTAEFAAADPALLPLIQMRLVLRHVNASSIPSADRIPTLASLTIIAHGAPKRRAGSLSGAVSGIRQRGDPMEACWDFAHTAHRGQVAIVLVQTSSLVGSGWRQHVRGYLVDGGFVAACVQLPTSIKIGGRGWTALVLVDPSLNRDQTCAFITADALDGLVQEGADRLGYFAGAAVAAKMRSADDERWPAGEVEDRLGRFLGTRAKSLFGGGYRDLAGFCRQVSYQHIRSAGYALAAERYVDKKPDGWRPTLDDSLVRATLAHPSRGRRIYVIGNNGEGKSFLLGELVSPLVRDERHVFCLAFSSTDRFAIAGNATMESEFFHYLGAGPGKDRRSKVEADLTVAVARVFSDKVRHEEFVSALDALGFADELYLIPSRRSERFLEDVEPIEMGSEGLEERSRGKVLGLKRRDGDIIPYEELSSGEQQLLALCAKLLGYARANAVFLVDEPDTSLHVSWQQALPRLFAQVGRRFAVDIVVATHSPILIASASETDDVAFLAKDGVLRRISKEDTETVESALLGGFETYTPNNRGIFERCATLVSEAVERANDHHGEGSAMLILAELDEMLIKVDAANGRTRQVHATPDRELLIRAKAAVEEILSPSKNG